jgi:hypothetical protein
MLRLKIYRNNVTICDKPAKWMCEIYFGRGQRATATFSRSIRYSTSGLPDRE